MPNSVKVYREDSMVTLCRMAANTKYEDLRDDAIGCAKRSILDTMGVIVADSSADGCKEVVDLVKIGEKSKKAPYVISGQLPQ